jgi:hypothetical protein
VDAPPSHGGLFHADGGVGRARGQDAEDRGDLVGALGQGHGDGVALPHTVVAQHRGDPPGRVAEFAVGERVAGGTDDRGAVRLGLGEPEEAGVQGPVRNGPGGQGRHRAPGQDVGGEQAVHRPGPGVGVRHQACDEAAVGVERGVGHAGLDHAVAHVPVEEEAAVEFGDLGVQVHLRALGDDPGRAAEGLLDVLLEDFTQSDGAGVHDGSQHRRPLGAGEVAQYLDTAVRAVGDALPQTLLEPAGLPGERK